MMSLGLSAKDARTLGAGVMTIGLLIGVSKGLPAVASWQRDRAAEARDAATQAALARASIGQLGVLRDSLVARRGRLAAIDSTLISGVSPSAAAAELASTLDELAAAARLKVNAMQLRADSAAPGALVQIGVRVTGITDVTGLGAFLRAVESNDTPLRVRDLTVNQSEPAAADSKPEGLRIDLFVESMVRIVGARRS